MLAALLLAAGSAGAQTATQTPTAPAPNDPAPTVTFKSWTEMAPLLDRQSKWILKHIAEINSLRADVAALKAEVADLKLRMNRAENSFNINMYYGLTQLCYANSMQSSWVSALVGLKPFPLGDLVCPPAGEKIYTPVFIGGQASVLKPPQ